MPTWAMIETGTWRDAAFLELSAPARLLFIWTWTNPEASICGLYRVSTRQMARALEAATGEPDRERDVLEIVDFALAELGQKPMVLYDYDGEVLWVVERAKRANRSPKTAIAMRREYDKCPVSPLREAFAEKYAGLLGPTTGGTI